MTPINSRNTIVHTQPTSLTFQQLLGSKAWSQQVDVALQAIVMITSEWTTTSVSIGSSLILHESSSSFHFQNITSRTNMAPFTLQNESHHQWSRLRHVPVLRLITFPAVEIKAKINNGFYRYTLKENSTLNNLHILKSFTEINFHSLLHYSFPKLPTMQSDHACW